MLERMVYFSYMSVILYSVSHMPVILDYVTL